MAEPVKDLALYARLLRYVLPYWRMFLISLTSMVILAGTSPAVAALLKPMMDGAFLNKDPQTIVMVPVLFVLLFALRSVADFSSGAALHWVSTRVVMDLRADMFQRLLTLPSSFYDHHVTGRLISRFSFDVLQVKNAATNAVTVVIRDTLAIIGLLGWMFYLDWRLSLISLFCAPFIALIVLVARQRLRKMGRKVQETMGDINNVVSESIHNHKLIKLYDGRTHEAGRFGLTNENNRRFMLKYAIAATATGPAIQLITAVAFAVIVYIATRRSAAGLLSIGDFVSFCGAMAMLLTPLKRLIGINEFLQKGLAACESIFGLMDEAPERDSGTRPLARVRGQVEFRRVQFTYNTDGTDALSDISLTIAPGETLALVGPSGSGKTTLTGLLAGFYQPGRGSILIDGVDIRDCTLATLRANIALVSQDVLLFNDSVRNNIAYGSLRDCTDAEVEAAARAAHALEFINELPQGFATVIGEKGQRLSGGQRQRLAIARALLKDAPILIMDEATSSLDTEAERHIQAALEAIKKGRTCIIIAHRLSTIENADRIVVIDQGRIVQTGTHAELVQQAGLYTRLHRVKFNEVAEPESESRPE